MDKLIILGSAKNWHSQDLVRAAKGRAEIEFRSFKSLAAVAGNARARSESPESETVIVRAMPNGSLEQVIFRMDVLNVLERKGCRIINPPRSLEIAIDKYLCLARIQEAGVPVPPSIVCQSFDQAMVAFADLGEDVVVKPLFGGEGRGLMRVDNEELAERAFRWLESTDSVIYLQKFIRHSGSDLRILVIGNEMLAMKRNNSQNWRTNASLGALCETHRPTEDELDLAQRAANAVGANFCGVDIIRDETGTPFVLEVNGVPGWKRISETCQVDVAERLLNLALRDSCQQSSV